MSIVREWSIKSGHLLQASATSPVTVKRVWDLFGGPIPLIVADPWYGEVIPEIGDTCEAVTGVKVTSSVAQAAFVNWMIAWTKLWAEALAYGGAFYVWGGAGKPGFRPFFEYLARVERETGLFATPITWKKKRAYGVQHNYLFCREECVYLCKGDPKKPRVFNIPLTDKEHGYQGYNKKYPAKSNMLRRSNVWEEDGPAQPFDEAGEFRMADVWDETEILRGKRHECEKPRRVNRIPIEAHTNPGEGVLDLFAGSASLSETAEALGRKWVAVEIDGVACDKIAEQMS